MTTQVKTGAPPERKRRGTFRDVYKPVINAAIKQRGEWHSMPLNTGDYRSENIYGAALTTIARELGVQVSIREDRIYIQVPE